MAFRTAPSSQVMQDYTNDALDELVCNVRRVLNRRIEARDEANGHEPLR